MNRGRAPKQNRVDPFGALIADPARGRLMGNRGVLHDEHGNIRRFHQLRRWIYCRLEFKGRRRPIMRPGHYTELFFWDEPTALAAGHRPCAECMRERFNEFRTALAAGDPSLDTARRLRATEVDDLLQRERIAQGSRRVFFEARLGELPDGVIVLGPDAGSGDPPQLLWDRRLWRWSLSGYGEGEPARAASLVQVLTPRPTVHALHAGFQPVPRLPSEGPLEVG
jgi:hypothetical protein